MTVIARRLQRDVGGDERRCWLRFVDGMLVDPRRCPAGILVRSHWSFVDGAVPDGEPNAVCACTLTGLTPQPTGEKAGTVSAAVPANSLPAAAAVSWPEPCSSAPETELPPEDVSSTGRHRSATVPAVFSP